jgi:hypothetical protein
MKFHNVVIWEQDGRIVGRHQVDSTALFSHKPSRQHVRECSAMLRAELPGNPFASANFSAEAGGRGFPWAVEWQQAEPFSAMATFVVEKKPVLLAILLSGLVPEIDAIVVSVTRETLPGLFEETGADPAARLAEIRERPVAIEIPRPAAMAPDKAARLCRLSRCLALAFFLRAEDSFNRVYRKWQRQCANGQAQALRMRNN